MHMVSVGEKVDTQVAVPHLVSLQEANGRKTALGCECMLLHTCSWHYPCVCLPDMTHVARSPRPSPTILQANKSRKWEWPGNKS